MKKNLVVLGAVALTAAAAVPALAFENEFHGMYRAYGYVSNALAGGGTFNLKDSSRERTSSYVEQRARLQYIAKASDDLKLVTHFELDTLFGGAKTSTKYPGTDAGGLDADQITLETKNIYLDFNLPSAPINVKLGIQPFADAYQGVFGNFDGSGVVATGKFGKVTPTVAWFRVNEDSTVSYPIGKQTVDQLILDGKFAVNNNLTVGANYYLTLNDANAATASSALPRAEFINMLGVNAAVKAGPAAINAFAGYQFGDYNEANDQKLSAFGGGVTAKIKAGPGNVNVAALYLSGEKNSTTAKGEKYNGWVSQTSTGTTSYFNAANTWLLIRNGATINTSTAIGGNDLTKGGRGLIGLFAGYEGTQGKLFYSANAGYAQVAEERGNEDALLGTEVNATIGYKLYDNLSASFNAAYAFLGDGAKNTVANGGLGYYTGAAGTDAVDPYAAFIRVDYSF